MAAGLRKALLALPACLMAFVAGGAFAHPGSGIAVDARGNVWFVDAGEGIWRMDAQGALAPVAGPPFHWLALDPEGRFARTRLPKTAQTEMRAVGRNPTLVLSSDYPIALAADGLWFAEPGVTGALTLVRISPGGARTVRATLPAETPSGPLKWLEGMAAAPDGSILFTDRAAVHRVAADGTLTTVASGIAVPGCTPVPGYREEQLPALRGLAVGADGTIWVAATGCGALLKVTPAGEVSVAMRAEAPWAPTGVAIAPGAGATSVHVLEVLHPAAEGEVAVPRVRALPIAAAATPPPGG